MATIVHTYYRLIFEMQLQNKKLFNPIYIFAETAEST